MRAPPEAEVARNQGCYLRTATMVPHYYRASGYAAAQWRNAKGRFQGATVSITDRKQAFHIEWQWRELFLKLASADPALIKERWRQVLNTYRLSEGDVETEG